jgi:hypothetical protein
MLLMYVAAAIGGLCRSAIVWMLLLAASTIYLFDYFSYNWVSAHLDDTIPLLIQNVRTDFQVMRSKMTAVIEAVAVFALLLIVGASAIRYGMRRFASFSQPVSAWRVAAFVGIASLLVVLDRAASPHLMTLEAYEAKNRILWQAWFNTAHHPHPRMAIYDIASPRFRQTPDEQLIAATLSHVSAADVRHPFNIFVFVVDSLRDDAITAEMAPNLFKLKQVSLPVQAGIASSNVTHISWFSIAHALNPAYWNVVADQAHSRGAIPMRLLRQSGYQLRAISCPSLEYFGFERSTFGDTQPLATSVIDQRALHDPAVDTGEGDIDDKVMSRLGREVDALQTDSRAFYLVMLDSTHHDYSWSKRYAPKYMPFTKYVSIFKTDPRDILSLRNRYNNAVNFVDTLMGEFIQKLNARGLMEHSIIVVTGDHGEEFLERGHLVHASELNRFQTRVPILIYIPKSALPPGGVAAAVRASHVDIFPTIFDALGLSGAADPLLDGRSLLRGGPPPAEFSVMASTFSPDRVMLDAGDYKLIVEFEGVRKIERTIYARRLLASKVLNANDDEVTPGNTPGVPSVEQFRTLFQPALDEILENP